MASLLAITHLEIAPKALGVTSNATVKSKYTYKYKCKLKYHQQIAISNSISNAIVKSANAISNANCKCNIKCKSTSIINKSTSWQGIFQIVGEAHI